MVKEMDTSRLMETKEVPRITNQIKMKISTTTVLTKKANKLFLEPPVDTLMQSLTITLNLVIFIECLVKPRKKHSATTSVAHFPNAEKTFRKR